MTVEIKNIVIQSSMEMVHQLSFQRKYLKTHKGFLLYRQNSTELLIQSSMKRFLYQLFIFAKSIPTESLYTVLSFQIKQFIADRLPYSIKVSYTLSVFELNGPLSLYGTATILSDANLESEVKTPRKDIEGQQQQNLTAIRSQSTHTPKTKEPVGPESQISDLIFRVKPICI